MFLATVEPGSLAGLHGGTGISWWQTIGGLLAVFGLLMLCLRLLKRFHPNRDSANAGLLTAWPLGPRREIQVLRLGDRVHYIYRHESAMVLLKDESLAEYEATFGRQGEQGTASRLRGLLDVGNLGKRALTRSATG